MICYKGIIVCLLQISIINRPSKGYVMHFCQGMYVYMPKKKRRRVLLHLMPMNSKCIAPAITHSQRTDLIAVHVILALCEFHYCEFHYCDFSKHFRKMCFWANFSFLQFLCSKQILKKTSSTLDSGINIGVCLLIF